jgi:hypothetical protein
MLQTKSLRNGSNSQLFGRVAEQAKSFVFLLFAEEFDIRWAGENAGRCAAFD